MTITAEQTAVSGAAISFPIGEFYFVLCFRLQQKTYKPAKAATIFGGGGDNPIVDDSRALTVWFKSLGIWYGATLLTKPDCTNNSIASIESL